MKYYKQLNENGEVIYLLSYDTEPNITDPLTGSLEKSNGSPIHHAFPGKI